MKSRHQVWSLAGAVLLASSCSVLPAPPPVGATVTVTADPGEDAATSDPGPVDFSTAEKAALRVRNIGCGELSTGSGFAIGTHLLITNRHVVDGSAQLELSTFDGRDIKVTGTGATTLADLAVVQTDQKLPAALRLAERNPQVGEDVTAVGYPLGGELTTTTGKVIGFSPDPLGWSDLPMLENDAPIEHGSSGSPLLDNHGDLVGVVYAGSAGDSQYAVPVEVLADLIADTGAFSEDTSCEAPAESPIPASATACSANVFAGPKTSCPFALSVEAGWRAAGQGSARFQAFSPVTKLDYEMRCQDGNPVVCRAQTDAVVYIRQ